MTFERPMDFLDTLQKILREYDTGHIPHFDRGYRGWRMLKAYAEAVVSFGIPVTAGNRELHIHDFGYAGLVHLFDRSAGAEGIPHAVARDGNHEPVLIRDPATVREIEGEAAVYANRRAYAVLVVLRRVCMHYHDAQILDPSTREKRSEDQVKAREAELLAAFRAFPESVEEVMDAHDPDFRPTDLEEARAAYPRHLETRAKIRTEDLRWEAQKHRVDLGAACVNLDRARGEVAKLWKDLSEAISRSGTLDEIERAYAYGVRVIGEIRALNLPLWAVGDQVIEDSRPTRRTVYGRRNDIRARQPDGDVPGSVTILDDSDGVRTLEAAGATVGITRDGTTAVITVTLPPEVTDPITVTIVAQNECGENDIEITFDPGQAPT